jgi:hypothetical protein
MTFHCYGTQWSTNVTTKALQMNLINILQHSSFLPWFSISRLWRYYKYKNKKLDEYTNLGPLTLWLLQELVLCKFLAHSCPFLLQQHYTLEMIGHELLLLCDLMYQHLPPGGPAHICSHLPECDSLKEDIIYKLLTSQHTTTIYYILKLWDYNIVICKRNT